MPEENINKEEEDRQEVEEKKGTRKLSSFKFLLFWGVILIVLIIGAYLLVEKIVTPSINVKKEISSSKVVGKKGEIKKTIYTLEPLVINLAEPKATKYLRLIINLELDAPGVIKEIEVLKPCLLDSIITILSSKALVDIENTEGKISLRREIITCLNEQLTTGRVINVYFTEFIIQ